MCSMDSQGGYLQVITRCLWWLGLQELCDYKILSPLVAQTSQRWVSLLGLLSSFGSIEAIRNDDVCLGELEH